MHGGRHTVCGTLYIDQNIPSKTEQLYFSSTFQYLLPIRMSKFDSFSNNNR